MSLALLIGASPKDFTKGAIVRIPAGWWRFRVEGCDDSIINAKTHPSLGLLPCVDKADFILLEPASLEIEFAKVGTESCISIYVISQ